MFEGGTALFVGVAQAPAFSYKCYIYRLGLKGFLNTPEEKVNETHECVKNI